MCSDTQGTLLCLSLNGVKLTTSKGLCHHSSSAEQNWPWNIPMGQGPLDWLVELLVDGDESCVGAYDSTLEADIQHIFFILCWGLLEAHVLGLEE